ncbi:unnamed protein product [Lepeophtheirus salmonis]|uniref:(salmon louse) hypothetical protein n=1 Tax=Lepeophtheirus salmonis TaxID=72036 RepID=A0A817FH16_LEPSM|nr:unnamed protein product [Lepeophtheirus salmonis]CAG9478842.1 unnamed protein product [Lepeophtheirus salmonis]
MAIRTRRFKPNPNDFFRNGSVCLLKRCDSGRRSRSHTSAKFLVAFLIQKTSHSFPHTLSRFIFNFLFGIDNWCISMVLEKHQFGVKSPPGTNKYGCYSYSQ